ncbi:MAG: hypothetical protein AVDCRST_MAG36-2034, partial [uncultured Nocardioidaceae bacterium]
GDEHSHAAAPQRPHRPVPRSAVPRGARGVRRRADGRRGGAVDHGQRHAHRRGRRPCGPRRGHPARAHLGPARAHLGPGRAHLGPGRLVAGRRAGRADAV